jgi:UDP-3-O-[3-hydroxymyristoyl] N-acetylglucosamine deacetylase
MLKQRTLKTVIRASGVGLHGGVKVNLTLRPAARIPALSSVASICPSPRKFPQSGADWRYRMCSCLEVDGVKVGTIEHLMSASAVWASTICWVDLDAPEVPSLDGSAAPFVF